MPPVQHSHAGRARKFEQLLDCQPFARGFVSRPGSQDRFRRRALTWHKRTSSLARTRQHNLTHTIVKTLLVALIGDRTIARIPVKLDRLVVQFLGFGVAVSMMVMATAGCSYNSTRTGTHKQSHQESPIVYTKIASTNPVQATGSEQRDWGRKEAATEGQAIQSVQTDVAVSEIAPNAASTGGSRMSASSASLRHVSLPITNEPPFFFAIMEDGRWRVGGENSISTTTKQLNATRPCHGCLHLSIRLFGSGFAVSSIARVRSGIPVPPSLWSPWPMVCRS